MAHGIILSKDRPAQLHLCLESIIKNHNGLFDNLSVLYTYSTPRFKEGYDLVIKEFPGVTFIDQMNYYEDIKSLVDVSFPFTSFFTDDDIMYGAVPVSSKDIRHAFDENDAIGCLSLRLGLNTTIQDPFIQSETQAPSSGFHFIYGNKFIAWNCRDCPPYMNFGYPMSVDGHLFRTTELDRVISQCKFTNPNQQEIAMSGKSDMINPFMISFPKSVVINTPINRVQSTCMNRAGETCGQTPEDMNENYCGGFILDLDSIKGIDIVGCHQEIDITWTTK